MSHKEWHEMIGATIWRMRPDEMAKSLKRAATGCPVIRALGVVGDKWSLLIVHAAFKGIRRFGKFQVRLGLAKNILTVRLKNLVVHGILTTVPASDGSAYREYVLTQKGQALFPVLLGLGRWGKEYMFASKEQRLALIGKAPKRPC